MVCLSPSSFRQEATPRFTTWEKRATTDHTQIIRWWAKAPYNIGIATGPSGLLIIDCDTAQDQDAPQWRVVGDDVEIAGKCFPRTLTVQTPSGGRHLYFSPRGIALKNTVGKLGRHVDTRGVGGYIVGPGSVLKTGYYRIVTRSPVAQLPGWIAGALMPHSPAVPPASQKQLRHSDVQAILERELQRVRTAPTGSRNSALNIAAFLLGKLAGSGKITERDAWEMLQTAARNHIGTQGFTESEMNGTIRSGLAAGIHQAI